MVLVLYVTRNIVYDTLFKENKIFPNIRKTLFFKIGVIVVNMSRISRKRRQLHALCSNNLNLLGNCQIGELSLFVR